MVVNSTLIKDDRRVLAIKELSKLLKDKNYNFDQECVENLVKRFNQKVSSGPYTYPCRNIRFKTHYVWYSFKEKKFFVFAEDCYGYSYPDPKYLSHLSDQLLLFTDFLKQIGSHNFDKNRGTLLYTLMKFLSENFDESMMNVLASKILDIKANNLTSEMESIREKLKMFITEHFIDLFFGKLIESNKEEFLNEICIFDKESTSFGFYVNRNVETFKMIKGTLHKRVGLPLKALNYIGVIEFEFLNVSSLSSRIDEWAICFAKELGQNIKFKEKQKVSLSISGFTSILFDTSDFRFR